MRKKTSDELDTLIDLTDATLHLARKLSSHHFRNPDIVPLSQLERLVLMHLHRNPGLSPSELSHDLALRPSNTSTAVRGLVGKDQLRRDSDPEDGRSARLFITATARRSIDLVHREWHELMDRAEVSDANLAVALSTIEALSFAMDHQTRRNG